MKRTGIALLLAMSVLFGTAGSATAHKSRGIRGWVKGAHINRGVTSDLVSARVVLLNLRQERVKLRCRFVFRVMYWNTSGPEHEWYRTSRPSRGSIRIRARSGVRLDILPTRVNHPDMASRTDGTWELGDFGVRIKHCHVRG